MDYERIIFNIKLQLYKESNPLANLCNSLAFIYELEDVSWAGIYFFDGNELVLGPFQGKAACNRIKPQSGVCGAAFSDLKTYVVKNVHDFPGHIACDFNTNSEIVLPIIIDGKAIGVLDLDSYKPARFDEYDKEELEQILSILTDAGVFNMFKKTRGFN